MFRLVLAAVAAMAMLCLPKSLAVEKSSAEPQVRTAIPVSRSASDLNSMILEAAARMPSGGTYSASKRSFDGLSRAATLSGHGLSINPEAAQPSFCSGATYLVFLQVIDRLQREGSLNLDRETLAALPVAGQRDGQGVWGRWNANGPGTARLFAELGLGRNFTSYADARPGDFMKVFWTDEIGRKEHGHSVIFLGCFGPNGEYVKYWSSNLPREKGDLSGYGVKLVSRTKIARCIFSRLEQPGNLARIRSVPATDPFLAGLLTHASNIDEVRRMCGF
jgi:hypothetical protein